MKEKELKDGDLYEYRYHYKSRRSSIWFYAAVALLFVVLFAFRIWWTNSFGGVYVSGRSMNPTLSDGDQLLMHYGSEAERGDVIVVDIRKYQAEYHFSTEFIIKRLIAVEGDSVYCEDGVVYLKKAGESEFEILREDYVPQGLDYDFSLYEVGEGEIFFLGDNRMHSQDSRYKDRAPTYGGSNIDCLYKVSDIYGVVPDWAIEHKNLLKHIPGMNIHYS